MQDNLNYTGNQAMIKQLANLILDNANKYADTSQPIVVSLQKVGNKIHFIVQNKHSQDLPDGEVDFLFDRFYRVDRSAQFTNGRTRHRIICGEIDRHGAQRKDYCA